MSSNNRSCKIAIVKTSFSDKGIKKTIESSGGSPTDAEMFSGTKFHLVVMSNGGVFGKPYIVSSISVSEDEAKKVCNDFGLEILNFPTEALD